MAKQPANEAGPSTTRDTDDLLASLDQLDSGELVQLQRTAPIHLAGIIGDLHVPDGGGADLPNLIKESYGGGGYRVQRKVRHRNGVRFGQGCATFQIAGEPRTHDANANPAAQPIVIQGGGSSDMSGRVLQILQDALARASQNAPAGAQTDIVGLIGALQQTLVGGQRNANPDPFDAIDRAMGTLAKMKAAIGGKSRRDDDDDDDEDESPNPIKKMFGGMSMPELLMMKMLNESGGMGGMMGGMMGGGMPGMMPPQGPMSGMPGWPSAPQMSPPPPPTGMVWHPQLQTWVPYPPPMAAAQSTAHAPTIQSSPRAARQVVTPQTNDVDTDTFTNGETIREKHETLSSEPEDYEPLSVSDIVDDLRARSESDRDAFLMRVFEELSKDPKFAASVNGAGPPMAPSPDECSPST